jgi:hypothetical protein
MSKYESYTQIDPLTGQKSVKFRAVDIAPALPPGVEVKPGTARPPVTALVPVPVVPAAVVPAPVSPEVARDALGLPPMVIAPVAQADGAGPIIEPTPVEKEYYGDNGQLSFVKALQELRRAQSTPGASMGQPASNFHAHVKTPSAGGGSNYGGSNGYGGGSSAGHGYGSVYGSGYSANTTKPKPPAGFGSVLGKDGQEIYSFSVAGGDADWWEVACQAFPTLIDKDGDTVLQIPETCVTFKEQDLKFQSCTYDATEQLVQSLFGRKLSPEDRGWLARHPFATDEGIPTEYTATCVQGLVEPYGLRVSRVRVRRGKFTPGQEYTNWKLALGCNPFAMADGKTTNAEAAQKLGMSPADADAMFRFEYDDRPLPGSIVGETGWTSSQVTSGGVGAQGGHARYVAPRGGSANWVVSVQLDWANRVEYQKAPVVPAYHGDGTGRRRGKLTLNLSDIRRADGRPVAVLKSGRYRSPEEAAALDSPAPTSGGSSAAASSAAPKGGAAPVVETFPGSPAAAGTGTAGRAGTSAGGGTERAAVRVERRGAAVGSPLQETAEGATLEGATLEEVQAATVAQYLTDYSDDVLPCVLCQRTQLLAEMVLGINVCVECYNVCWEDFRCPTCRADFSRGNTPTYVVGSGHKHPEFCCPSLACTERLDLDPSDLSHQLLRDAIEEFDDHLEQYIVEREEELAELDAIEADEDTLLESYERAAIQGETGGSGNPAGNTAGSLPRSLPRPAPLRAQGLDGPVGADPEDWSFGQGHMLE